MMADAEYGLAIADRLVSATGVALRAGETVPFIGPVCTIAREVLKLAAKMKGKLDDIWATGKRAINVLEILDAMEKNVEHLHEGRDKVEKCMRELEKLLHEVKVFVEGFGEAGWMKRAFSTCRVGRKLSMMDHEIGEKLETLRAFYALAKDNQMLGALERIEFRLETEVAKSMQSGEAPNQKMLLKVGEDMGFTKAELSGEIIDFMSEHFAIIHADSAKTRMMMEKMMGMMLENKPAVTAAPQDTSAVEQPSTITADSMVAFRSLRSNTYLHVREAFEKVNEKSGKPTLDKHQVFQLWKWKSGPNECGSRWRIHPRDGAVAIEVARRASHGKALFLHVRKSWEKLGQDPKTKCEVFQLSEDSKGAGSSWVIVPCADGSVALRSGRDPNQYLHVRSSWATLQPDNATKWQVLQLSKEAPESTPGSRWLLLPLPTAAIDVA